MEAIDAEQGLKAEEFAKIVRESTVTVITRLKRYMAESPEGLLDAPRAGRSMIVTDDLVQYKTVAEKLGVEQQIC